MSKISQLHAELTEQAYELGFEDLGEAEQAGYGVDWEKHKLLSPQDLAHEVWLKERFKVLADLNYLIEETDDQDTKDALNRTVEFIRGCHD